MSPNYDERLGGHFWVGLFVALGLGVGILSVHAGLLALPIILAVPALGILFKYPDMGAFAYLASLPIRMPLGAVGSIELRASDIIGLLTIGTLLAGVSQHHLQIKNGMLKGWAPFLVFAGWSVFSTGVSWLRLGQVGGESIAELARLLLSVGIGLALTILISDGRRLLGSLLAWEAGALMASAQTLAEYARQGLWARATRYELGVHDLTQLKFGSSPMFRDPNNYASYILTAIFAMFALWYLASALQNRKIKWIASLGLALAGLTLVATFSRSGWLGAVAGLALLAVISPVKALRVPILLTLGIGFVVVVRVFQGFYQRFVVGISGDFSAMARLELMSTGLHSTLNFPVFGLGLGNFLVIWRTRLWNPSTHNLFLKISSETGIVGLAIFLLAMSSLLKPGRGDNGRNVVRILSCGIVALMVQSLAVEYLTAKHFWAMIGIIVAAKSVEYESQHI